MTTTTLCMAASLPSSPAAATTAALESPPLVANTFGHRYRPTPLPTPSLEGRQPSTPSSPSSPSSPSLSRSSSTRRATAAADPGAVRVMQKLVRQLTGTDFQSGGGGAATVKRESSATTCTNGGGSDVADDMASSKPKSQQQPSCKAGRRHQRSWQASATMSTVTSPVGVVNSANQQHQRPSSSTLPPTSNAAVAAAMERKQAKSARRQQAEANAKLSTEHEVARAKNLSAAVENKLESEPQADSADEPEKRYSQEMQRHLLGQMVAMLESFNLSGQQRSKASR